MESNKTIKMSVSTFLLIFAIFAIIIMAFVIYNLYNEKVSLTDKVNHINVQTNESVQPDTIDNTFSSNAAEQENNKSNKIDTNEKFVVPSLTTGTMKNATNNATYSLLISNRYYGISLDNGVPYIRWYTLNEQDDNDVALNNWAKQLGVTLNSKLQEITGFTKKVIDVHLGGIGQDITGDILIFQMEDGTIEYSTIENIMKNVSTQGKIEELNNIVKLQDVNVHLGEAGGHVSIIAIDQDNNCYDLGKFIDN